MGNGAVLVQAAISIAIATAAQRSRGQIPKMCLLADISAAYPLRTLSNPTFS